MKNTLYITLLICPFLLYNCGPDNPLKPNPPQADTLPPITTEGLQTFGYKVNGKVVRYESQSARYINLDHIPETGLLGLQLFNYENTLSIKHDSIANAGSFIMNPLKRDNNTGLVAHRGIYKEKSQNHFFNILIEGGGEILRYHIDNEKPEYIISGTFWCTLLNEDNPTDTVYITDGRFDLYKR